MALLRRHRRDHRARAPKRRKRRNLVKFIPEADRDFALTANQFVTYLQRDTAGHGLTEEDVSSIAQAVLEFRAALAVSCNRRTRNMETTYKKNEARERAEAIVRRFANIIRANPQVSAGNKKLLRIKERPAKLKARECPEQPPALMFAGSGDGSSASAGMGSGCGVHVLKFFDQDKMGNMHRAKPDGAARIELYFDLVPTHEPVPVHPAQRAGWPKYLRSYTKSPIEAEFPVPSEPMLVVYWARWADATGEVGRWSRTCVARVEGWTSKPALLEGDATPRIETKYVLLQTHYELPDHSAGDDELAALTSQMDNQLLNAIEGKCDVSRQLQAPPTDPKQMPLLEAA